MAAYIPFVNSMDDVTLLGKYYTKPHAVRVSVWKNEEIAGLPRDTAIWVDGCIEGLHDWKGRTDKYKERMKTLKSGETMGDPSFQERPDKRVVFEFAEAVLNRCQEHKPSWITVPQLPLSKGASRTRVNRLLSEASGLWRADNRFKGKLVLPLILTHKNQYLLKARRDATVNAVLKCVEHSQAEHLWVVDSDLNDQAGTAGFGKKRFPALVQLHTELRARLPKDITVIAGPYWGMNLVLWARGLIAHPAIGIGSGFQYYLSGSKIRGSSTRVSVSALRRTAVVDPLFQKWLDRAVETAKLNDPRSHRSLSKLAARANDYQLSKDLARAQVAAEYAAWIDLIQGAPKAGRALALYQDLSASFISGKAINEKLPAANKTRKEPWRVAQVLMLNCL